MAKCQFPKSDVDRLTLLQAAVRAEEQAQAEGGGRLQPATLAALQAGASGLAEALAETSRTKAAKHAAAQALDGALEELKVEIRILWADVRRTVRAGRQPTDLLILYQLPLSGRAQFPTSRTGWLDLGRRLVLGDEQAIAKGYPGAGNGTALRESYEAAAAAASLHTQAARTARQAQAHKASQRKQATLLCRSLARELRLALLDWEETAQTQEMRGYGVAFLEEPASGETASRSVAGDLFQQAEADMTGWDVTEEEQAVAEEPVEEPVGG